jgi:uncharacterized membrane protein YtjA (UPF0391 family)
MLYWALTFLIVALAAGFFGFAGIASAAAGIAQVLFYLFIVLFIFSLIFMAGGRRNRFFDQNLN